MCSLAESFLRILRKKSVSRISLTLPVRRKKKKKRKKNKYIHRLDVGGLDEF